jgi:hypothetical protein
VSAVTFIFSNKGHFTATGIAPELNRIPILILPGKLPGQEPFIAANVKAIKRKFKK